MRFKNFDFSMFDCDAGLQIGEPKASNNGAVGMGQCGIGMGCSGGGGQCGIGMGCSYGSSCGGDGGKCSYGSDCSGGGVANVVMDLPVVEVDFRLHELGSVFDIL